jgi:hypothetical protein
MVMRDKIGKKYAKASATAASIVIERRSRRKCWGQPKKLPWRAMCECLIGRNVRCLRLNDVMRIRRFLYRYWEWLAVVRIYAWIFHIQNTYEKPPAAVGFMWVGALVATGVIRGLAARVRGSRKLRAARARIQQITPGSAVPPVMYQMAIQANRIDKALRQEYPDDVEHVLLVGGYDGKIDTLESVVILKGSMGHKLMTPFPGDPAGAWMFEDVEREKLLRMRAIVWSYAMAIGDAHFKPPVIFSNAQLTPLPK